MMPPFSVYVLFFTIHSQYDPLMDEGAIDTHQKISGIFADFRWIIFVILGYHFNNCQHIDNLGL